VFASSAAAGEEFAVAGNVAVQEQGSPPPDFTQSAHQERLKILHNCDEVAGVAPCKIGEIIIEAAEDERKTEVWRRQN
jgi:hypothetical protein